MTPPTPKTRVMIIGGGLAGIAAAVRLADAGLAATLIETRQRLGGRATSFTDPTTGQLLDNCQHVLMGCCTNLLQLYDRLGVQDKIDWHEKLYFIDAKGNRDIMQRDDLAAPLHMSASLLSFKSLSLKEKLAIGLAMMAMMRLGKAGRKKLHHQTFLQWLLEHHQPPGAIEKFWGPIVISACNEWPGTVACDYALQVFQEGFLCHEDAYVMGLSRVPLVQLYDQAKVVIEQAGGQVLLSTSAEQLVYETGGAQAGQITGLKLADGRLLEADAFIAALPFDRLAKLCDPALAQADGRLARLDRFTVSPIIGVHLWFDRPVMDIPHAALMQSPLQWVFNKGMVTQAGDTQPSQHVHGVISAAYDWVNQPASVITEMAVKEMALAFERARGAGGAQLVHSNVIKEKRATFSACADIENARAHPTGPIANLYIAGDWSKTGWPATMEGAVRSGYQASHALLSDWQIGPSSPTGLAADLAPTRVYQMISGFSG